MLGNDIRVNLKSEHVDFNSSERALLYKTVRVSSRKKQIIVFYFSSE